MGVQQRRAVHKDPSSKAPKLQSTEAPKRHSARAPKTDSLVVVMFGFTFWIVVKDGGEWQPDFGAAPSSVAALFVARCSGRDEITSRDRTFAIGAQRHIRNKI
jgi:hypothetical protein